MYNNFNNGVPMDGNMGGFNPYQQQATTQSQMGFGGPAQVEFYDPMLERQKQIEEQEAMNVKVDKEVRKKHRLNIEAEEFDGLFKTKITTITEIGRMVNKLFKTIVVDCEGCLILPTPDGKFETILYLKPLAHQRSLNNNEILGLEPVIGINQNNGKLKMADRVHNLNTRYKNKTYKLTQPFKDILEEFMIPNTNKRDVIDWNRCVCEKTTGYYNGYSINVQVSGIDINKVFKKIYGDQICDIDEETGRAIDIRRLDYSINVIRGLGAMANNGIYSDYLVSVMQLDVGEMERVAKTAGIVPLNLEIPMIRD